ncbi:hypothetical protein PMN64_25105 [Bradyrhizobium sp. UFLA01-814]|uniref:hypothetical protein n=1 Tax=Bradyrhizobium sp. UFLA01-814 TaxID=3023480 RepID=UPI00398A778B
MTDSAIGPDSLMMAIALGGRPEDNAKMVWSRECIAYFFQQIGKGNAAPISHPHTAILRRNITWSHCNSRAAILLQRRQLDYKARKKYKQHQIVK